MGSARSGGGSRAVTQAVGGVVRDKIRMKTTPVETKKSPDSREA